VVDAEAKRLVSRWRELPPASSWTVLEISANADAAIAETLRRELDAEPDLVLHQRLLATIAGLDDPKRHRAMIEQLVADPKLTAEDLMTVFLSGDVEAERDSEDYVRAHWDELIKRFPVAENEDFPLVLRLEDLFTATCDASRRDDTVKFLQTHFASIASGDRPTKQAVEQLDRCIARKKLVEPAMRVWLAK
jgi:hypothetical protein